MSIPRGHTQDCRQGILHAVPPPHPRLQAGDTARDAPLSGDGTDAHMAEARSGVVVGPPMHTSEVDEKPEDSPGRHGMRCGPRGVSGMAVEIVTRSGSVCKSERPTRSESASPFRRKVSLSALAGRCSSCSALLSCMPAGSAHVEEWWKSCLPRSLRRCWRPCSWTWWTTSSPAA